MAPKRAPRASTKKEEPVLPQTPAAEPEPSQQQHDKTNAAVDFMDDPLPTGTTIHVDHSDEGEGSSGDNDGGGEGHLLDSSTSDEDHLFPGAEPSGSRDHDHDPAVHTRTRTQTRSRDAQTGSLWTYALPLLLLLTVMAWSIRDVQKMPRVAP
ncbi:hypothetical protein BJ138DRAFT_905180 [Hygrophoropsis aurantiaca]|uniref:Uncharacterized protein n=1 Tax=Hygrophoropsis aurantiaca TaxID=72124 RepID=A0ACB8ADE7_9AGAM|nr:hypothetical protein BJ138DRAFT_905180 [Hygrophoropsis aurantiaca]